MRIKYFGNMKDDNGNICENTRIAVIYYKDSEKDKASEVYHALKNRFVNSGDNGDGLNEYWFKVIDRNDFEDLKEIYMQVKRGEYETDTEETVAEQPENVPEHETPETTTTSEVKECEYCRECIYYKKCAVNTPYRIKCKSTHCLGCLVVCCEDFVSCKSIDDIYEEQKMTESAYEPESVDCDYILDDDLPY